MGWRADSTTVKADSTVYTADGGPVAYGEHTGHQILANQYMPIAASRLNGVLQQ